jgi:hypothetical protein
MKSRFGRAVNRNNFYFIFSISHHYMFLPLLAILRCNIHSRFLKAIALYYVVGVIAFKDDCVYFT